MKIPSFRRGAGTWITCPIPAITCSCRRSCSGERSATKAWLFLDDAKARRQPRLIRGSPPPRPEAAAHAGTAERGARPLLGLRDGLDARAHLVERRLVRALAMRAEPTRARRLGPAGSLLRPDHRSRRVRSRASA